MLKTSRGCFNVNNYRFPLRSLKAPNPHLRRILSEWLTGIKGRWREYFKYLYAEEFQSGQLPLAEFSLSMQVVRAYRSPILSFIYVALYIKMVTLGKKLLDGLPWTTELWTSSTRVYDCRYLCRGIHFRIFYSLVVPVLIYDDETRTLNSDLQRHLDTLRAKCLRTILEYRLNDFALNERLFMKLNLGMLST